MGILLSILLIVLGLLGAETMIAEKAPPACRNYLAKLRPYQESLGLGGLILGLLSLIEWITWLPHIGHAPSHMLLWLMVALLTLSLGLIFGLEPIRRNLKNPGVALFATADGLRTKLLPSQQIIGLAAIAVGVLYLLVCI